MTRNKSKNTPAILGFKTTTKRSTVERKIRVSIVNLNYKTKNHLWLNKWGLSNKKWKWHTHNKLTLIKW